MRVKWCEMRIRIFVVLTIVACTYQEELVTENAPTTTAAAAAVTTKTTAATAVTRSTTPQTSFSCAGRITGYYADVETGCRTYHYCIGSQQYTYECPNNTLFQQRIFICNHWYLVDCETSEKFYDANLLIGQRDKPFVGEDDAPRPPTHPAYPTTQRTELKETTYDDDDEEGGFSFPDLEDIQRVESTTSSTTAVPTSTIARTESAREERKNDEVEDDDDDERFIRLKFADTRGLFFIPNGNNSVESFSPEFREFVIPRINEEDVMQFKADGSELHDLPCPKYCDLRYVRPGTCHPCITIK